jgi:limonene-1,2-epoxide hydrolase
MSNPNEELVAVMCNAMTGGSMDKVVACLTEDVFYHNLPFDPIIGRAGVKEFLNPFVDTPHGGLETIDYLHTLSDGNTVMNARNETWRHKDVTVILPVAGVFEIENGLISRWCDYWDTATLQPLVDRMKYD